MKYLILLIFMTSMLYAEEAKVEIEVKKEQTETEAIVVIVKKYIKRASTGSFISLSSPSLTSDEIKWPSIWLVGRSGTLRSAATFLANSMPCHRAGSSPGPCVTATASNCSSLNCSQSSGRFFSCSRLAKLG